MNEDSAGPVNYTLLTLMPLKIGQTSSSARALCSCTGEADEPRSEELFSTGESDTPASPASQRVKLSIPRCSLWTPVNLLAEDHENERTARVHA